jgi:toxin ParE1/3/4
VALVCEWVERDSPDAARRLAAKIRDRVNDLAAFPSSGRVVPEIGIERYRETIVRPYRVVYEVRENDLVILRVRHSRRDLPE